MSDDHTKQLRVVMSPLANKPMKITPVLDDLLSELVLTLDNVNEIKLDANPFAQVCLLITKLQSSEDSAFDIFLCALQLHDLPSATILLTGNASGNIIV